GDKGRCSRRVRHLRPCSRAFVTFVRHCGRAQGYNVVLRSRAVLRSRSVRRSQRRALRSSAVLHCSNRSKEV
ncbi:sensor domain-containing diguanylate cyclase, partial [Sesbania bispinosa]